MKNQVKLNEITKEIKKKFDKLSKLQKEIIKPKKMISASLIKRYLGTKKQKRNSYAYYLSTSNKSKTKLHYVPKDKIKSIEPKVKEWKKYQTNLKEWKKISESINDDFKKIGKIQNQLEQK